jgi:hypothetical protein
MTEGGAVTLSAAKGLDRYDAQHLLRHYFVHDHQLRTPT